MARGRVRGAADCRAHLSADLPPGIDGRAVPDQARRMSMAMSTDAVAIIGFITLFALMLLRVPVGRAMGLVGVTRVSDLVISDAAFKTVGHTAMRTVTDYTFGV